MLNGTIAQLPQSASGEALEPGMYPARLVNLIDIGTQESQWGNKHQLVAIFELPTENGEDADGNPMPRTLSTFFSVPAGRSAKSKLWQFIDIMAKKDNEPFSDFLGRPCQVEVKEYENKEGVKNNSIGTITKLSKGMDVAKPISNLMLLSEDAWDTIDEYDIPDWVKSKIKERVQ